MYPIETYRITPNLFGFQRWQAEITGQRSRFARRAYNPDRAARKIARDESNIYDGGLRFMQSVGLPLTMPLRRWHDRICQGVEQRRRQRRRTIQANGGRDA